MTTRIQLRRDTALRWASVNPVLAAGEPAVESDTGKLKVGDGASAWSSLPYILDVADLTPVIQDLLAGLIPASYTDEQVRDVIGATISADGDFIAVTASDAGNTIRVEPGAALTEGLAAKQDAATLAADTAAHVADGSALDVALTAAFGTWENVKKYGAKGDGTTDDTAAIRAAVETHRPVFFPPGDYVWSGPGLSGFPNLVVVGAGRASSRVLLAPGTYLLDDTTALQTAHVSDLTFMGGAGAVRSRWSNVNVSGHKVFSRVTFKDYTGAAVSSNAADEPYWSFLDCRFEGASDVTSMGVALAGHADDCVVDRCSFLMNRIDIKLARPSTARVKNSDFVPWTGGTAGSARVRLWLVPDASYGFVGESLKFGNEGIADEDWHVLIAAEGSGTYVGDRFPDFAQDGVGSLIGLTFRDCIWQGSDEGSPPLIRSHCHDLQSGTVDGTVIGTYPEHLISYSGTLAPDKLRTGAFSVGPIRFTDAESRPPAVSNFTFPGRVIDPGEMLRADPTVPMEGPGDHGDFLDLTPTAGNWSGDSTVTTGLTDRVGGTDAAEISASAGGQFAYKYLPVDMVPGVPMFIEFDLRQGAAPISDVQMDMAHDGPGPIYLRRLIVPPAGWTRFRFAVPTTLSSRGGAAMHLRFRAMGVGSYRVGRVRIYQGRSPQAVDPAFLHASTTTTTPSAGAAAALPATPAGYVTVHINGVARQIPYY